MQLQRPYEFLNFREEREAKMGITFDEIAKESEDKASFKRNNPNLHQFEKTVMDKWVGTGVDTVVKKAGFRRVKWMPCVSLSLGLLLVLNCLACFDRADYMSSVASILAIFFLNDNSKICRD